MNKIKTIRLILVFLIMILNLSFLYSQTKVSIKGYIEDVNHDAIAYANVALVNIDSTIESGVISNEKGLFELTSINYGNKRLLISFLGYRKKEIPINLNKSLIDVGKIILNSNNINIQEVNVKASPFIVKSDRLITNVSASDLSSIGSARDVLDKVPSVFTKDEKITVFGKGTPSIYINNRKVYDQSELDNLKSDQIKNIEVIHNPGAKYSSEDQAVIIFHTKNKDNGFSMRTSEQLKLAKYLGNTTDLNLNYNHNKLNLSASFLHDYGKRKSDQDYEYTINSDTLWQQYIYMPAIAKSHKYKVKGAIDYVFDDKHSIGAQYQGRFLNKDRFVDEEESVYADYELYNNIIAELLIKDNEDEDLLNTYYEWKPNTKLNFSIYADYLNTKSTTNQETTEEVDSETATVYTYDYSNYKMYATKAILKYILNKNSAIDVGGEIIKTYGLGTYIYSSMSSDSSYYYKSKDYNYATFVSYNLAFNKKWHIKSGCRFEHFKQYYDYKGTNEVDVDNSTNKLYPDISISYSTNNVNMSLSASKRAVKPTFSELNGNSVYVNYFLSQIGNTNLDQESSYSLNYILGYKFLNLNIGYTYTKDPIISTIYSSSSSSSQSIISYKNYSKSEKFMALLTLQHQFGFYHPQLTSTMFQPIFKADYNGENIDRNKTGVAIHFYNNFSLPSDYILSFNFNYQSSFEYYITKIKEYKSMDVRLRKDFFNKKLSVNLYVNDIFNMQKMISSTKIDSYCFDLNQKRETRYVTLNVSYRFNDKNNKYKGKHVSTSELNRF